MHSKCLGCAAEGELGRRYECVVCGAAVTYCGNCYDAESSMKPTPTPTPGHKYYHPMKVIFNQLYFELYFSGEQLDVCGEAPQSYKCAFCLERGFTAETLQLHIVVQHQSHADAPALLAILKQMALAWHEKSTEIRCQEKSRGGLSYEVILAEPAPNVAVPKRPVTPGKNVSAEEIEQKLKAAEERRVSLEARKMAEISIKLAKVEEATRKKDEITNEFITQTKEQLESKMETHVEKREAIISDMKEKLKIHAQEIEKTRETLEQQKANEQKAIEEKLKTAQALRDENIKKMLDRLKEHNTIKIAEIKSQVNQLENQKLEEKARIIENKLFTAEQNREKELLKKIEKVQKLERRAEVVRQNKAQSQDMDGQQNAIASSG